MLIVATKDEFQSRLVLLHCLPRNGTVCEIGVLQGDYSNEILQRNIPKKLHLIDIWRHVDSEQYSKDPNNQSDKEGEKNYTFVLNMFENQIESGNVSVHRMLSLEAASLFPDKYFDWIYIDGDHTYNGCMEDLRNYYSKVKDNGFIVGHDYSDHEIAKYLGIESKKAVNDFIKESNSIPILITMTRDPTYVLAKNSGSNIHNFIGNVISAFDYIFDIDNDIFFNNHYFQKYFGGYDPQLVHNGDRFVHCLYKK